MSKSLFFKRLYQIVTVLVFITGAVFLIVNYKKGTFRNLDSFQEYIDSFGLIGPVILGLFQCFKVIYGVIPCSLGYIAGPILFGPVEGILANYIGICLGSMIAFLLSKKYGEPIMRLVLPKKYFEKSMNWIQKKNSDLPILLWLLLLIPISPDDFLCYFAGLSKMSFNKFVFIILTVKPWLIIIYGLIFGNL